MATGMILSRAQDMNETQPPLPTRASISLKTQREKPTWGCLGQRAWMKWMNPRWMSTEHGWKRVISVPCDFFWPFAVLWCHSPPPGFGEKRKLTAREKLENERDMLQGTHVRDAFWGNSHQSLGLFWFVWSRERNSLLGSQQKGVIQLHAYM